MKNKLWLVGMSAMPVGVVIMYFYLLSTGINDTEFTRLIALALFPLLVLFSLLASSLVALFLISIFATPFLLFGAFHAEDGLDLVDREALPVFHVILWTGTIITMAYFGFTFWGIILFLIATTLPILVFFAHKKGELRNRDRTEVYGNS